MLIVNNDPIEEKGENEHLKRSADKKIKKITKRNHMERKKEDRKSKTPLTGWCRQGPGEQRIAAWSEELMER